MAEIHFYSDEAKQNEIYPAIDPVGVYPTTTVGFANNLVSSSKIVSDTKFNYRKTGGSENVLNGEATINSIRGSVNCTTIEEKCTMDIESTTITATINVATFRSAVQNNEGDYTFIYDQGSWKRNGTIVNMASTFGITITGVASNEDSIIVHFIPEYIGTITIAKPTKLTSIKFNQFNKNDTTKRIQNHYINASGDVTSGKPDASTNTYGIIWFECLGNNTYTIYDANENSIYRVAWNATAPTTSSRGLTLLSPTTTAIPGGQTLSDSTFLQYYTPPANGYLCVVPTNNVDKLCCHLTEAGDEDTKYEEYIEDNFIFDIEYTLKDNNNTTIFPNGLLAVPNYADEINYKEGKMYKRIKRDSISQLPTIKTHPTWSYIYDNQYVYYYDEDPQEYTKDEILNKNTNYIIGTEGTEKFIGTQLEIPITIQYPLNLKGVVQEVIKNKINILNMRNGNSEGSLRSIYSLEENASYTIGKNSIAEGKGTKVEGDNSHAEGYYTTAKGSNQHVEGKYNIEDSSNLYAHIIGNGTSQIPSNLHTVDWNGNAWYQGDIYVKSASGTNRDAGSKKLITIDEIPTVYSGSTEPSDALGKDGDLFVLIDS